ncbi:MULTISPECIES: CheR family methyltransferase [Bacillus]|uniref:CheR family methyltransferase n=1 Tax=Bacillus TaxID=1386 RepID=UPI0005D408E5|nr:CheR family methyltransferase [Bacillus altitudinis]KQL48063.1 histidine kinase [Bacillus sp. FJAT-21955]KJF46737.1 histidine kinase [Bacillus altitudinis]MBU8654384.1 PAS domain-containing protein [Bacillus altitudinis]MBU8694088.1 PAS domain-containing protein [Bacillus altitudinis]MBU8779853.1 PAS domain-containing protein [Bacillus altitudinis]
MQDKIINRLIEDEHVQAPVIGIGVSPFEQHHLEAFFQSFPHELNASFIVVQNHVTGDCVTDLEALVLPIGYRVKPIKHGEKVMKNTIYVCPQHAAVTLTEDKRLHITEQHPTNKACAVNSLFQSLANVQKEEAYAIFFQKGYCVGSGLLQIVEQGGTAISCSETNSGFDRMYHQTFQDPSALASYIANIINVPHTDVADPVLIRIIERLEMHKGIAFSTYEKRRLLSVIQKRMRSANQSISLLSEYDRLLEREPDELDRLHVQLLSGTTSFFRDMEAFRVCEHHIIPSIIDNTMKNGKSRCRIWIAGCSTGEEAYSFAMLFLEEMKRRQVSIELQVFATDINRKAIQSASKGVYSLESMARMPEKWRARYFEKKGDAFIVKQSLRKHIVFAPHNLLIDSPFIHLDFISCRNVLMYFQPEVQKRVLSRFQYALKDQGMLILGPNEKVPNIPRLFHLFNEKWNIYTHSNVPKYNAGHTELKERAVQYMEEVEREYDACFIIDDCEKILAISNGAYSFLAHAEVSDELCEYVTPDYMKEILSQSFQKVWTEETEVVFQHVLISKNGRKQYADFTVKYFDRRFKGVYVILIRMSERGKNQKNDRDKGMSDQNSVYQQRIVDLENELNEVKQKEQEARAQLKEKNKQIEVREKTNEHFINIINNLKVTREELYRPSVKPELATLFVDREMNIRYHTPTATSLFTSAQTRHQQTFQSMVKKLSKEMLYHDIQSVISDRRVIEREIETNEGEQFTVHMTPFYDQDREGAVMTWIKMTEMTKLKQALHLAVTALDNSHIHIVVATGEGVIQCVNQRFCQFVQQHEYDLIGKDIFSVYYALCQCDDLAKQWDVCLREGSWTGELYFQDLSGRERWERVSLHRIDDPDKMQSTVMRISEDITSQKQSEKMLMKSEMLSAVGQLAAGIAHEIRNPLTSLKGFLQLMIQSKKYQKDYADVMMSEFNRLESIINEFLVLSRSKSVKFEPVNVNLLLEEVIMVVESQAVLKGVSIQKNLAPSLPHIQGIPNELKQVFLNILKNGIEAMDGVTGVIQVTSLLKNDQMMLIFEDQGKGIPEDEIGKLGEPFYTTKEKGTGLGLMMTIKIIESHGGTIRFESKSFEGTRVIITFPSN